MTFPFATRTFRNVARRIADVATSWAEAAPVHEVLSLRGEHRLIVNRQPFEDSLSLVGRDGVVRLRISVNSAGGSDITIEAPSLSLRTSGDLAIEAERVRLHGRQTLELSTGDGARVALSNDVGVRGDMIYLNS